MAPPKSSSRGMTANPTKPAPYRRGKALAESHSSSGESSGEEDAAPAKPTAQSKDARKVTSNLKSVNLDERRKTEEARERAEREQERAERERLERDAGFVTESSSDSESEGDGAVGTTDSQAAKDQPRPIIGRKRSSEEISSGSEEDSDSDSGSSGSDSSSDRPRTHMRPTFMSKKQREAVASSANNPTDYSTTERSEQESARRAAETHDLVQEHVERDTLARLAGKKNWDDDEPDEENVVDDTDGLDPELEYQQWVVRELGRVKRARAALEEREAEIAEVERRRNLTTPEREAEDRAKIEEQKKEQEGRGKMAYMQTYRHKGAFYHDEDEDTKRLLQRDVMGSKYANQEGGKETLPEYLQVRDATKIGKKGRTRYKDLKSEDTGRWGDFRNDRKRPFEDDRGDDPKRLRSA